ncbi:hypothetical protein UP12_19280 (plasmid) [Bacillus pumilus]|uniref:hypothetical protein n=1 Tax=Bacillus pumilus TaxID=1408 RepID=UPI000776976A|nr:hypothetical protein [Bacillus pumilus]AMM99556.1 hypothetical protein UP12_19280 [Bacillus pumilus]
MDHNIERMVDERLKKIFTGTGNNAREWYFPENVDNKYKIFGNVTVKTLFTIIVPFFLLALSVVVIPPFSSIGLWIAKFIIVVFLILAPSVYVMYRPVKHRDNIHMRDFIREYFTYRKKQKVYFVKSKNRELFNRENL